MSRIAMFEGVPKGAKKHCKACGPDKTPRCVKTKRKQGPQQKCLARASRACKGGSRAKRLACVRAWFKNPAHKECQKKKE